VDFAGVDDSLEPGLDPESRLFDSLALSLALFESLEVSLVLALELDAVDVPFDDDRLSLR
jgi:hypothetical protein